MDVRKKGVFLLVDGGSEKTNPDVGVEPGDKRGCDRIGKEESS
jgi:hypothetical protein